MKEFTWRALLLGLVMCVILGAANAYLGLKSGVTIAATYPAAVIGMAVLRIWKGSILEENIARTAGSIGESVAAGAVFTLPAFLISGAWSSFDPVQAYWKSTAMMVVGSIIGVLFVSLVRRVMVEDPTLPFPESLAAAEIHKAGQRGAEAARYLFWNIGVGSLVQLMGAFNLYAVDKDIPVAIGTLGANGVRLGPAGSTNTIPTGGITMFSGPTVSPAYMGVGYVIGPELGALQFSGGLLAWGVLVPLFMYFLGPRIQEFIPAGAGGAGWADQAAAVWRYIVRPIAVGGMLVGAAYTLFRMGKNLTSSLGRALKEVRHGSPPLESMARTERYMGSKTVLSLIGVMFLLMIGLYVYISGNIVAGAVAAVVMLIVGFFFATVSGNLVGMIGSSNNPISGLTLSTLIIAALLMVALGIRGPSGVAVVLGVAAVVCVSSAVAGELLQDFKVGYMLGGTPAHDSDRRADRRGRGQPRHVLSALHSVSGQSQERRHRIRRSQAGRAPSRIDGAAGAGDRGRGHALAAGGHRNAVRRSAHHVAGPQSHAGFRGHVSALADLVRHFHRRHAALGLRRGRQAQRLQRRPEGSHRKRRHPDRQRPDRGRSAHRTGGRLFQV